MANDVDLYEMLLRAEGLHPEPEQQSTECSIEDCIFHGDASDTLHGILTEIGMSPEEFLLTVDENQEALKDFLVSRMGLLI